MSIFGRRVRAWLTGLTAAGQRRAAEGRGDRVSGPGGAGSESEPPAPLAAVDPRDEGASAEPPDASPIRDVGHYRILSRLDSGGMGVVYKARDLKLRRLVALKFLTSTTATPQQLQRFRQEARAASACNHPNICTIYEIGEYGSETFIAMELLEGQTLRAVLEREPLAPRRLLALASQLTDGLDAAHALGIVHRDIKPGNLFVTPGDRLKIVDFGIATLRRETPAPGDASTTTRTAEGPLTDQGVAIGTSAYMSPEQMRGEVVDARSDLFSAGAVLYEMAARRRAFPGNHAPEIFAAILAGPPALPESTDPALRQPLQRIVDKALEQPRELRYQHASDLGADVRRLERDVVTGESAARAAAPAGWTFAAFARGMTLDLLSAVGLAALVLTAHTWLDRRPSGKYLTQFQTAFLQESLDRPVPEDGDAHLPLVVNISALHPEKTQRTDRALLDVVIRELHRHGARGIGVDLSFDDVQPTDFQYFHRWLGYRNVRLGVFDRAVEDRDTWLGRPEFAPLAAGIALPRENPEFAFAYIRRWSRPPAADPPATAADCDVAEGSAFCKQDLIQLPVALWLMADRPLGLLSGDPGKIEIESRLKRMLDPGPPRDGAAPESDLEYRTYVIDYSHLREIRKDVVEFPTVPASERAAAVVDRLNAFSAKIGDRLVFVGDLDDPLDQVCQRPGIKAIPGVLVHATALATLDRGMMLEPTGTPSRPLIAIFWASLFTIAAALRAGYTAWPRLRAWPYRDLQMLAFVPLGLGVVLGCRWLALTSGLVWPNYLWVAAGLVCYPFAEPLFSGLLAAPRILRAAFAPLTRRITGG